MPTQDPPLPSPQPEKKPYQSPRFAQHGTIQNLTLAGTGRGMEFFMGPRMA